MVVAIIDFAHCGTSMLAGILEVLGVPMVNENYHERKREDWEIIEAANAGEAAFRQIVAQRDFRYDVWGFKFPGAWKFGFLDDCLIDPVYLSIWKDPVSVTRRRYGKNDARWMRKLQNTIRQMRQAIDGHRKARLDVTAFSYLHAIVKPEEFVQQVASVTQLTPSAGQIARAVAHIQPNEAGPRAGYPTMDFWND